MVARKDGPTAPGTRCGVRNDVICSQRRGQSQKPEEIYELIEDLVPNGKHPLHKSMCRWSCHHKCKQGCCPTAAVSTACRLIHLQQCHRAAAAHCRDLLRNFWPAEQPAQLLGDCGQRGLRQHHITSSAQGKAGGAQSTEARHLPQSQPAITLMAVHQI